MSQLVILFGDYVMNKSSIFPPPSVEMRVIF